jgi:hypothetical protein
MNETWVQVLTIIGSNLVIMLTFFGVSISLHNGMREEIRAINVEMKDFHTKLALQDQEFKMLLCSIEQKNKK